MIPNKDKRFPRWAWITSAVVHVGIIGGLLYNSQKAPEPLTDDENLIAVEYLEMYQESSDVVNENPSEVSSMPVGEPVPIIQPAPQISESQQGEVTELESTVAESTLPENVTETSAPNQGSIDELFDIMDNGLAANPPGSNGADVNGSNSSNNNSKVTVGSHGQKIYHNYGTLVQSVNLDKLSKNAAKSPRTCDLYDYDMTADIEKPEALYIVIDSSVSMEDNIYNSRSTTCAYMAAQSAIDKGIKVSVINFSDKIYYAKETLNKQVVAEVICKNQKGYTVLPEAELEQLVTAGGRKDFLLISDGEIANLDTALPYFSNVINRNLNNRAVALLFDINASIANKVGVEGSLRESGFERVSYFRTKELMPIATPFGVIRPKKRFN